MSACPDEATLAAFVSGRLDACRVDDVTEHVDGCSSCFGVLIQVARTSCDASRSGGPPLDDVADDVPRVIEEYFLLRRIGQGGMGQVFLAVDLRLDRPVAIKLLARETREAARARFLVEARAVARLSDPNVVTIHRVGEIGKRPFLVYEFVRGKSLDHVAKPLPWPRAREIALALARGLAAAHRAGVLHRDIKPANAILADDGSVKLLDFGLAKLGESSPSDYAAEVAGALPATPPALSLTRTGALLGTPLYMAPEAWRGEPPSERMDLYSLGAMVHELCTGRPLHAGHTLDQLRAAALSEPVALGRAVPGIDRGFASAIDGCLALDPAGRHASAEALCARLAPPDEPRRGRRGRIVAAVAAAAIAIALLATLFARSNAEGRGPPGAPTASTRATPPRAPRRCSADHWCWDPTQPTHMGHVWARAPDDAWAVGSRGTIRHWDGQRWTAVDGGTVADLGAVHGRAADDVWIVGDWATILHWDGIRFRTVPAPTKVTLVDVLPLARDDAWAIGIDGVILHWDGLVWTAVPSGTVAMLSRLAATGPDDVWADGNHGTVVHWDGRRWSVVPTGSDALLTGLVVFPDHEVWIVGYSGFVRRLVNGEWRDVELPLTPAQREDFWISAIWATGRDDIWLMSKREPLLHWDGRSWRREDPGTRQELYGLHGSGKNDLWATARTDVVVHWDGTRWAPPEPSPRYTESRAVWASAPDDVWSVGSATVADVEPPPVRGIAQHYDGARWSSVPGLDVPALYAVHGAGRDDVWLAGDGGTVLHWDGRALERVDTPSAANLRGLAGARADDLWAVGEQGTILRWQGAAWRPVESGTRVTLRAVWAIAEGAWAVGDAGVIERWDGQRWTRVPSGVAEDLRGVWGSAPDDVWAVGNRGTMLHWNGREWRPVFSDTPEHLMAIAGSGRDDVWAVSYMFEGGYATLVHWDGTSWTTLGRTPRMILRGVWSLAPSNVWAVGAEGMLLHYEPPTVEGEV